MKNKIFKTVLIVICVVLVFAGAIFMFGGNINKKQEIDISESSNREMPTADAITGEITEDTIVEQKFINTTDNIVEIATVFTKTYISKHCYLTIELLDGETSLVKESILVEDIPDQHRVYVRPSSPITGVLGKELTLRMYSDPKSDTGLELMICTSEDTSFNFGKKEIKGTICFSITGQ